MIENGETMLGITTVKKRSDHPIRTLHEDISVSIGCFSNKSTKKYTKVA